MNTITLPSRLAQLLDPIDNAELADGTKRNYRDEVIRMYESGVDPVNYDQVIDYSLSRHPSARRNLKAAYRIVTDELSTRAKLSNASVETIQRFLWLCEALNKSLKSTQPTSKRNPHWLSQEQVDTLTSSAQSMRDYIVLSVLLGAGLRREEMSELIFDNIRQIPTDKGMQDVITVIGKGDKKRTIPISKLLSSKLLEWKNVVGGGRVARRIRKNGKIEASLSTDGIEDIVRKYGLFLGIDDLQPHDLRRSYGRLMYFATGGDIMRVMRLLGHSKVTTTQDYIGAIDVELPED